MMKPLTAEQRADLYRRHEAEQQARNRSLTALERLAWLEDAQAFALLAQNAKQTG